MRRFSALCGLLTVPCLVLAAGLAAAGDAKLPADFTAFQPDDGKGEVLIRQSKDAGSAKELLTNSFDALSSYFDKGPKALGAVGDDGDVEAQSTFVAARGDIAYTGLAVVHVGARDAVVGVAYDRADHFAASKANLTALLGKNLPESTAPRVKLQAQRLPDGSGAIKVPEGWNVNAVNSMVDVIGPNGEECHFGLWTPVYTPAKAAAMRQLGVSTGIVPVAPYTDPESALKMAGKAFAAAAGMDWTFKRRIDQADAPGFPGRAKYLLYEADVTKDGKTTTTRSLVLVDVMPTAPDMWVFYASGVGCPADQFDRNLPTLMAIWKSWKTDDRVFQQRLQAAAESMKETARILQDGIAYRQHVMDRVNDDWSEVIRGTSQVVDTRFDTVREVDANGLKDVVEKLNEHEGFDRWKIVPLKDINHP